jgi:hypothetical protein
VTSFEAAQAPFQPGKVFTNPYKTYLQHPTIKKKRS